MLRTLWRKETAAAVLVACALGALWNFARSDEGFIDEQPYIGPTVVAHEHISNTCSICHGMDGISKWTFIPSLAGLDKTYIVDQLRGLKARAREDRYAQAAMWGIAANLKDDEIVALADYFSALEPPKGHAAPRGADLALGQSIFEKGLSERNVPACQTCHVGGRGDVNIPRVAGQHAYYMARSLREFREGFRVNSSMNFIAGQMNDKEIEAVADYMSTLTATGPAPAAATPAAQPSTQ